jgi:hypothetical protein
VVTRVGPLVLLAVAGVAGCNAILGIEDHPVAGEADASGTGSGGEADVALGSESGASSSGGWSSSAGGSGGDTGSSGSWSSGSGAGTSGGDSGDAGASSSGSPADSATFIEVPLAPDPTGAVADTTLGIVGTWYAYGDGWGANGAPPGACETKGNHATAQCSSIASPPSNPHDGGAAGFPPTAQGQMCLTGVAAQVVGTPPDYTNIYGIGLGLDLNNAGTRLPYDAPSHRVVGFKFTLSGLPNAPGTVRVQFPIVATNGTGDAYAETVAPGTTEMTILWTDSALAPSFMLSSGTEPPFDPSTVESIQLQVVAVKTAPVPVTDLCVSNLTALVQP